MCRTLALVPDIKQKDVVNRMYRVQITAVMSTFYSFADSVKSCVICSYLLSFLQSILKKLFDRIIEVDQIKASCQKSDLRSLPIQRREDYLYSLTKGNLFKLTEYEKILYVESNIFFLRNVDEIFDLDTPAGVLSLLSSSDQDRWHGMKIPPEYVSKALQLARGVKASLMLLQPNFGEYTHCISQIRNFSNIHFIRPDDEYFTSMFHGHWTHIHCKFACVPWQIGRVRHQPAGICLEHYVAWEDDCNLTSEVLDWRNNAVQMVNCFPSTYSVFKKFFWLKELYKFRNPTHRRIHSRQNHC